MRAQSLSERVPNIPIRFGPSKENDRDTGTGVGGLCKQSARHRERGGEAENDRSAPGRHAVSLSPD